MRILFCTTGGVGHLLPLRPLAAILRQRGHAVAWVTAPDALPRLQGLEVDLFAAGPGFEPSRQQFRAAHPGAAQLTGEALSAFTFPRLFGGVLAPAMLAPLEQAVHQWQPELVVHEPAAFAVPLVCQKLGLRYVTHGYGLRPPAPYVEDAMRFFGVHWQSLGLEAPADGGLYRHLYLDITPNSLQAPSQSCAEAVLRYNPYRADGEATQNLPADVRHFLQQGDADARCIYVTFGTVFNRSPALVAATQAAACIGGPVVVTVGSDGDPAALGALGPHVRVHRFVDQAALLPHCRLVVSHGGAGTLLGAASHGVVQLVLPQAADHFRNARALTAVGAGRAVAPSLQSAEGIAAAMQQVLASRPHHAAAAALRRQMSSMPDVAAAATLLERWPQARS